MLIAVYANKPFVLSVIMLSVIMLSVIMLSVVKFSVIMVNIVAQILEQKNIAKTVKKCKLLLECQNYILLRRHLVVKILIFIERLLIFSIGSATRTKESEYRLCRN